MLQRIKSWFWYRVLARHTRIMGSPGAPGERRGSATERLGSARGAPGSAGERPGERWGALGSPGEPWGALGNPGEPWAWEALGSPGGALAQALRAKRLMVKGFSIIGLNGLSCYTPSGVPYPC